MVRPAANRAEQTSHQAVLEMGPWCGNGDGAQLVVLVMPMPCGVDVVVAMVSVVPVGRRCRYLMMVCGAETNSQQRLLLECNAFAADVSADEGSMHIMTNQLCLVNANQLIHTLIGQDILLHALLLGCLDQPTHLVLVGRRMRLRYCCLC